MSYSTLKKALQLFEEPALSKTKTPNKTGNFIWSIVCFNLISYEYLIFHYHISFVFVGKKSKSFKNKSQRAKSVFKVPNFMKSDTGKSIHKIKEQIKNEKELNLVQINLERLHKIDKTSCVNNIGSNLVCMSIV